MPNIKYCTQGIGIMLICSLLLIPALACVPAPPPPPAPPPVEKIAILSISPASGKAAAIITLDGRHFLPGEEIEVIMIVGEIRHGIGTLKVDKIVADEKGAFKVKSGIPFKTPPGVYRITATGNKGSVGIFTIEVVK